MCVCVCIHLREYPWGKQDHMARLGSHEPLLVECYQLLSKTINPHFPSITHSPLPSCHPFVSLCSHPHHSLHITSSPHTYLTSHHPHLQPTSSLSLHKIGSVIVLYVMCKVSSPIILISHVHVYNYNVLYMCNSEVHCKIYMYPNHLQYMLVFG